MNSQESKADSVKIRERCSLKTLQQFMDQRLKELMN